MRHLSINTLYGNKGSSLPSSHLSSIEAGRKMRGGEIFITFVSLLAKQLTHVECRMTAINMLEYFIETET